MDGYLQDSYNDIYTGHYSFPCPLTPTGWEYTFELITQDQENALANLRTYDNFRGEEVVINIRLIKEDGKWVVDGSLMR